VYNNFFLLNLAVFEVCGKIL